MSDVANCSACCLDSQHTSLSILSKNGKVIWNFRCCWLAVRKPVQRYCKIHTGIFSLTKFTTKMVIHATVAKFVKCPILGQDVRGCSRYPCALFVRTYWCIQYNDCWTTILLGSKNDDAGGSCQWLLAYVFCRSSGWCFATIILLQDGPTSKD